MSRPTPAGPPSTRAARRGAGRHRLGSPTGVRVADLPYGKQRLVEIAVALGLKPKVLLLDEPAAGVPSHESERILSTLEKLPADIAILIIEHDMDFVMRHCDPVIALAEGRVVFQGTVAQAQADPLLIEAYLGTAA